ncbi:helix-turn-helix domain-containing protein [uncultured Hyphomonas sp.]|uniref:AraC family transcriptional regulator n=1 Tax=uncultured Hyphomonas sp. TaxID=225298 RepID=UPI002AABDA70|nr:helix-turn-helix domain-containing protein [uncultured Hyphomonas sp.]
MNISRGNDRIVFEIGQISPILAWAEEAGVDLDRVAGRIGVDPDVLQNAPHTKLPLADYFRIQSEIAKSLDDLTAQLSERKLLYQSGSFVISQLKSSRTLQDTIRSLASYFNMLHGGNYNLVRQSGQTLTLVLDDSKFPYRFRDNEALIHFVRDALLIKVFCLIDSLTGGTASKALTRVSLVQRRKDIEDTLTSFWEVPVQYNKTAYELVFDYQIACQQIAPATNADLSTDGIFSRVVHHLETTESETDTRPFAIRTEELISEGLETQQAVASSFGISVATLRRRLSEEDTSFRDLLLNHRMDRANTLLTRGTSVTEVSELLGYSDVRAFNRAFKNLRGVSPAVYARKDDVLNEGA